LKQHPQRASAEFQRAILKPLSRGIGVQKGRCVDRSDLGATEQVRIDAKHDLL
jgi:hypothetical protein